MFAANVVVKVSESRGWMPPVMTRLPGMAGPAAEFSVVLMPLR